MNRPVVYLGPSLPLEEAKGILDADYRPPVKRGDLKKVEDEGIRTVAIIDGVFLQSCSVGHREILHIINSGIKVYGAGSMGALRAAELHHYGMIGVGRIFEMYSQGEIEGDDEVALVFDPETLEPLSEPLVNTRFLLNGAVKDGIISNEDAKTLLDQFRSIYYPRRTMAAFKDLARNFDRSEASTGLTRYIETKYRDIKKEDAIALLNALKELRKIPDL
ncbi:MAG: TfuA-related McrA-glycine thioamidation protein [Methanomassiliicoccales archaeon]|nr:TfuA-related McrA-glycine thioamidation protein [Methanomassiliicoccales archaeon]